MTTVSAAMLALSGPSSADVTAVEGQAYGVFASVSLFGGPANTRGPIPIVTLPPTGSATPITAAADTTLVQFGPAIIFSSGPATVSTQGTTGPAGSVTSSASLQNVNRSGQEVFTATSVSSTCTASELGVSGSTTINNGTLQTSEGHPDVEGDETVVAIPTNPPPNYTLNGTIETVGDNFQAIFNEQIVNPDGSITVYAYHLRLLGPTAVGDVFVGRVDCGVTAVATTTTLPPTTTTTLPPTTTTTLPPTTTTTLPPTTTTTLPPATTTTLPPVTTTTLPQSAACAAIQAQRAAFNAQITALEASLAQALSGAQLAAAIAQLEATRAAGNAQFDQLLAVCQAGTTTTTTAPTTTTTLPPGTSAVCARLLELVQNPFFRPFIEPFLATYGCTAP